MSKHWSNFWNNHKYSEPGNEEEFTKFCQSAKVIDYEFYCDKCQNTMVLRVLDIEPHKICCPFCQEMKNHKEDRTWNEETKKMLFEILRVVVQEKDL